MPRLCIGFRHWCQKIDIKAHTNRLDGVGDWFLGTSGGGVARMEPVEIRSATMRLTGTRMQSLLRN